VTNVEKRGNLAWRDEINETGHRKQLGKKFCDSLDREANPQKSVLLLYFLHLV